MKEPIQCIETLDGISPIRQSIHLALPIRWETGLGSDVMEPIAVKAFALSLSRRKK